MRAPVKKHHGGFTLMEIMIALLVLSMIVTMIYGVFAQVVSGKEYVENGNEMYHQMRWAMEKMAYDLSCAYISKGLNSHSQFLGINNQTQEGVPQDILSFTSFSHIRYSADEKSSDQCEISYFVVQDLETETSILFRREDYTVDDDLNEGGEVLELVEGVVAFSVRYYNGEEWTDQWDSRNYAKLTEQFVETLVEQSTDMIDNIPVAVEIAMSMRDPSGQEVYLTTKVKLVLTAIDLKESSDGEGDDDDTTGSSSSGKTNSSNSSTSGSNKK